MKSISKFLGAATLAVAIIPAAFAATPTGGSAPDGARPEHQHRYVQVGRDRTWVHLDRAAEPQAANAVKANAPSEHEHRYVQAGRDRTWVHLDRSDTRAPSSDARLMGNAPAAPAGPSSQDLIGGTN